MNFGLKKFKKCGFLFLLFILILPRAGYSSHTIKIGLLTSPPDNYPEATKSFVYGAEIAVAEINYAEEKKGIQFLLYLWPKFSHLQIGLSELRLKIEKEEIQFLMGAVIPEAISPIARVAKDKGIPFFAFPLHFIELVSSGSELENLFFISPSPEAFQRAAVRQVAKFSKNRFFFLAQDSNMNRRWAKYFWEELRRLKPEAKPVGEFFLPTKEADYDEYFKIILSAKPEVCMSHLSLPAWLRFVPQAKKHGYFKKIIHFELEGGHLEFLASLGKEFPTGVWGVSAFPFWILEDETSKKFVRKFHERTGAYPSLSALSGYVSIYALIEAIKKERTLNREKIIKVLSGLNFPTPIGPLTIRASDRRALWPIWCGVSTFASPYPFAILKDLHSYGPDAFHP